MAIKIYGRLSSANVQKINWFCNYANVNVVNLFYGGIHGKTKTNEFKDMNPNSRVPVLDDNSFILYESNAILRYLSKKFNILVEKKIEINGKIDQWIDWGSFTFASPCSLLTAHKLSLPQDQRDEFIAEKAKNDIFSLLEIVEDHLIYKNFIVDEKFTLADIPLGIWCHRCINLNISFDNFPNINNWYLKLNEMESFKVTVKNSPLPPN
jgi:glutathione S-transferase